MKKLVFVVALVLFLNLGLVSAMTQEEIDEAKGLIDANTECKDLSESQLELLGEYYMEQMHPGESHELMHEMMGMEEGSDIEEQFHINMAKTLYCGERNQGMMGTMGSGGMMNMMMGNNMMGSGMMGTGGYGPSYGNVINVLYIILLIGLIIVVYLWILRLGKNMQRKEARK